MRTNLSLYLRKNLGEELEESQFLKILNAFEYREYKKGKALIKAGEIAQAMYFIETGCIRTYYLTREGDLKTRHIDFENAIIGSLSSFISGKPSFEYVETIENSFVFAIGKNKFYELVHAIPTWKDFYLNLLEKGYNFQNNKMESLITLSAKERYEQLLRESPHYISRLSNAILASYLDISPETLSRIKRALR